MQLLTATAGFVAFFYYTGCVILIGTLFLVGVESESPVSGQ